MGAALCIIADDVREPKVARAYVRHESLGVPKLAQTVNGRGGSFDTACKFDDPYENDVPDDIVKELAESEHKHLSFRDDGVLLMIGNTDELLRACEEAADAGILTIGTTSQRRLQLYYVRMEITWLVQTDTLIAIGPVQGSLLPQWPEEKAWHDYPGWQQTPGLQGQPTYVTTHDEARDPRALPHVIRWIKENDDKAWTKA
jgi:hypothetical protein